MTRFARFNTFAIVYGVVYCICFYYNWAVFRYYPVLEGFRRQSQPPAVAGPAILWYAWLAQAFVITLAVTLLVPRSFAERLGRTVVWVAPIGMVIGILIYEAPRWFF